MILLLLLLSSSSSLLTSLLEEGEEDVSILPPLSSPWSLIMSVSLLLSLNPLLRDFSILLLGIPCSLDSTIFSLLSIPLLSLSASISGFPNNGSSLSRGSPFSFNAFSSILGRFLLKSLKISLLVDSSSLFILEEVSSPF